LTTSEQAVLVMTIVSCFMLLLYSRTYGGPHRHTAVHRKSTIVDEP
jgi:hypothetical protein